VFDLRSQPVVPQRGMPASLTGGVVDASWTPLEVPLPEDEPLLVPPLLLVLPPLLLVLLPLEEPLDDEDELEVPPELELLNPLLLPLLALPLLAPPLPLAAPLLVPPAPLLLLPTPPSVSPVEKVAPPQATGSPKSGTTNTISLAAHLMARPTSEVRAVRIYAESLGPASHERAPSCAIRDLGIAPRWGD